MTARRAATLLLVRPGVEGPEVLMVERPARGYFGGLWVFPGGAVEPTDDSAAARRAVDVPVDCADFPWRAAALRETVEEVGLAVTSPSLDAPLVGSGVDVYRQVTARGRRLEGRRLGFLSQWVTPVGAPTRYDTRFYLARIDGDPVLVPQAGEVMDCAWTTPAAALARLEHGEWTMVTPTIHHLEWLGRQHDLDAAWDLAASGRARRTESTMADDESLVTVGLPEAAEL